MLRSLFHADPRRRASWRRVFAVLSLEVFAGVALWHGRLDSTTWGWFAASLAVVFIGGDSAERVALVRWGRRGQDAPVWPASLGFGLGPGFGPGPDAEDEA